MVGSCTKVASTILTSGCTVSLEPTLPTTAGFTATGTGLSICTKLARLESTLEVGECFFPEELMLLLAPFRMDNALESFVMKGDPLMRRTSGRKMGRDAHTMLIPACIVVQTSVFE
jgi:hypothetical protein